MAASEMVEGLKYGFSAERSWGVASARHTSGVVVRDGESPYLFDAPLGPSVVRWDLRDEERVCQFQVGVVYDGAYIIYWCSLISLYQKINFFL